MPFRLLKGCSGGEEQPVNSLPAAVVGLSARSHKTPRFLGKQLSTSSQEGFPILLKKISYRGQFVRLGVDTMSHTQPEYDFVRKAGKSRYDTERAF
jgi:hypothetical protein